MRFIKTKSAAPMGEYKATPIDAAKAAAAFRLVEVGRKNFIVWQDGRGEYVTDRQLARLQATNTWAPDF